jgi:hypothetical protein
MKRLASVLVVVCCLLPVIARPVLKPVMDVKSVVVTNDGLLITVNATGDTNTAGWTNVQLVFNGMTTDSVLYTFSGYPPAGKSAQVVTPVKAQQTLRAYLAKGKKQVTVKSATNSMSAPIPAAKR